MVWRRYKQTELQCFNVQVVLLCVAGLNQLVITKVFYYVYSYFPNVQTAFLIPLSCFYALQFHFIAQIKAFKMQFFYCCKKSLNWLYKYPHLMCNLINSRHKCSKFSTSNFTLRLIKFCLVNSSIWTQIFNFKFSNSNFTILIWLFPLF